MKSFSKPPSLAGKDIFIGIDVHRKTYSIVARADKETLKRWTTAACPKGLTQQLLRYFGEEKIHTAYEAGFSAFVLHRELFRHGIDSIVVHVPSIEVSVNNRVKTDRRDAQKLAELLEAGRLRGVKVPSESRETARMLTRTRQQLVGDRSAVKNRIRMKFHQLGLLSKDENRRMSYKLVSELLRQHLPEEVRIVLEAHISIWKSLDAQITKLERALEHQAANDPNEPLYRSCPGVGKTSARVLSNELGDLSQFKNEGQLFSYTGLTPSEFSSGEVVRRGHISRQGSSRVRAVLIEIAWRALNEDRALAVFFERLYPRTGKKKALVAVARKLIGRIRAAFRKGENYQLNYELC